MAFQPKSLPWLLAHEVRLGWREFRGKRAIGLGLLALLLAFGALMALQSSTLRQGLDQLVAGDTPPDSAIWLAVEMVILLLAAIIFQVLRGGTSALFERGDLDLLLTSPLSSKVVFASRLLGLALNIFLVIAAFLVVPIVMFMGLGLVQLWGVLPSLLALSLLGTSLGLLVVLLLVKQFGVKRTRTLASLAIIPLILITKVMGQQSGRLAELNTQHPIFSPQSSLWLPARAIYGNGVGLLILWGVAGVITWLTVEVLHRSFLGGTQESERSTKKTRLTTDQDKTGTAKDAPQFSTNLNRLVLLKEWRLMQRNPDLLSQLALTLVMLLPLFGSTLRPETGDQFAAHILLGFVALLTVTLTMALANLAIAGEEAPALLQASPAASNHIQALKLLAVLVPVWVFSLPLMALLLFRHYPLLWGLLLVLGASLCAALLRRWNADFTPATGLKKRSRNPSRDLLLSALEWINLAAWFGLGVGLNLSMAQVIYLCLGVIVGLMAIAYLRNRALGPALDFA